MIGLNIRSQNQIASVSADALNFTMWIHSNCKLPTQTEL